MPTKWHVIDANGKVLGRVATDAAKLLQGKHKAIYTPYLDTGDHVVILNVAKVKLTGRKEDQKVYQRHSGYPAACARIAPRSFAREARAHDGRSRARHAPEVEAR
jgi:large subunit ribosomal protein L13